MVVGAGRGPLVRASLQVRIPHYVETFDLENAVTKIGLVTQIW